MKNALNECAAVDEIILCSASSRLHLSLRGAEPTQWTIQAQPLLWRPRPEIWPQTAPILFPIVGWLSEGRYRHNGVEYAMGVHGFAAQKRFALVERSENTARFVMQSDAATRSIYPFFFQLEASYVVYPDGFFWRLHVANTGDEIMPYAIGIHPGFCWDWSKQGGEFSFEKPESPYVPIIAPGGLFSDKKKPLPMRDGRLPLEADTLAAEALCFMNVQSHSARLVTSSGDALDVNFKNYDHVALWGRPPAPFLCVECWTGYGDPVGFQGALLEKPSMRFLNPGASAEHDASFHYFPNGFRRQV